MGDMGDYWRDVTPCMKEDSKIRRADNVVKSTAILNREGIRFDSKNNGVHLIVYGDNIIADFWPSTGKYMIRGGRYGRGVFNLIKAIRG